MKKREKGSAISPTSGMIEWDLINPEGVTKVEAIKLNPHPATLEGKVVALRWNTKQNGDVFLNRVAGLLTKQVKDVRVVKLWEWDPETKLGKGPYRGIKGLEAEVIKKIADLKPSIVIAATGD